MYCQSILLVWIISFILELFVLRKFLWREEGWRLLEWLWIRWLKMNDVCLWSMVYKDKEHFIFPEIGFHLILSAFEIYSAFTYPWYQSKQHTNHQMEKANKHKTKPEKIMTLAKKITTFSYFYKRCFYMERRWTGSIMDICSHCMTVGDFLY